MIIALYALNRNETKNKNETLLHAASSASSCDETRAHSFHPLFSMLITNNASLISQILARFDEM